MDRLLTPNEAAQRAGCGRSSIMRALKEGSLQAIRDNRNRWQIDPIELDRWRGERPDSDRLVTPVIDMDTSGQVADTVQIAALQAENGQLRERLDELRQDRDAWRGQAEKLASEPQPVGFFARLFGSS